MRQYQIIFLFLLVASIGILNADVISINSGGGKSLSVSSNPFSESGFVSCVPQTCSGLGFNCGSYVEACGLTISCGSCSSSQTCTSNVCVAVPTTTTTSSGGGAGGAPGGTAVVNQYITITPEEVSATVVQGVEETRNLVLENKGQFTYVLSLSVLGEVKDVLSLGEDSFVMQPGESKTLVLTINNSGRELLTGKILISYSSFLVEVPVIIGTKTDNFLFDTSIFLSDEFRKIKPGSKITAQFNLNEVNSNEKVDVVARYMIKDLDGTNYYEDSETYFVQGEKEYSKEFPTQNLPEGKYVLGFEVSYPGAFAISSATFDVQSTEITLGFKLILGLLVGIVIILASMWYIRKRFNKDISLNKSR